MFSLDTTMIPWSFLDNGNGWCPNAALIFDVDLFFLERDSRSEIQDQQK